MKAHKSIWKDFMAWLKSAESILPQVWPPELPPESTPDFWFLACKHEMSMRDSVSAKVRQLVAGQELPSMTLLESWLFRRRIEWASQVALAKVMEGVEPAATLPEVLEWALVKTWASDGCISMWKHAERGGKPHPENPDGLSPIP